MQLLKHGYERIFFSCSKVFPLTGLQADQFSMQTLHGTTRPRGTVKHAGCGLASLCWKRKLFTKIHIVWVRACVHCLALMGPSEMCELVTPPWMAAFEFLRFIISSLYHLNQVVNYSYGVWVTNATLCFCCRLPVGLSCFYLFDDLSCSLNDNGLGFFDWWGDLVVVTQQTKYGVLVPIPGSRHI